MDEIPQLLPDDLRERNPELAWLPKWQKQIPDKVLREGKPFTIQEKTLDLTLVGLGPFLVGPSRRRVSVDATFVLWQNIDAEVKASEFFVLQQFLACASKSESSANEQVRILTDLECPGSILFDQ